jgi:hypothetical protein
MGKIKNLLTEADAGQVKWSGTLDDFKAKFVGSNGAKFGLDMSVTPIDYMSKGDTKLLDTLWKDDTSYSDFDDNGYACVCYDSESRGHGNLDSSTITKVSQMFVDILVARFKSKGIQYVYFQSKRPISKQIHAIIVPKIASKLGLQVKPIKTGWVIGKDSFK